MRADQRHGHVHASPLAERESADDEKYECLAYGNVPYLEVGVAHALDKAAGSLLVPIRFLQNTICKEAVSGLAKIW